MRLVRGRRRRLARRLCRRLLACSGGRCSGGGPGSAQAQQVAEAEAGAAGAAGAARVGRQQVKARRGLGQRRRQRRAVGGEAGQAAQAEAHGEGRVDWRALSQGGQAGGCVGG